ncbi:hypothetical protein LWI29_022962 [Acer saccharum]|uniref:ZF-HD dimerization-type domain-containing protein n=1 Tax=Acer saccharum TaxID=4024 RepID=A0AA39T4Y8_ACESA|nr:hypothetical protein LWI29_022962 [Acer saccharum]KAK1587385.1 hypothetical protein Q3G72_012306 [Acer saccharum]
MEVRGTPSYLGHHHHHHHNRDSSSSKISPSTPPTTTTTTVHDHGVGDAIFNLSQTLDHHHHHQSNVNPVQDTHDNIPRRSRRDPDTDPDPVPATASIATSSSTDRSTPTTATTTTTTLVIRYRECLKNHAASMGRHVVDGCGEFMPGVVGGGGGEEEAEGNSEALKCAACECHRNFHRKEINGHGASSQSQLLLYQPANYNNKKYHHHRHDHNHHHHHHQQQQQQQPPPPLPPPATFYDHHNNNNNSRLALGLTNSTTPAAPLMMVFGGGGAAAEYSSSGDLNMFNSNAEGGQSTVLMQPKYSKKRFRTKFSQEQKEKMMELAEKIGWRIQKQDEKEVQEFCAQVGVKRQVFKVWMHNNKQASVKNKE